VVQVCDGMLMWINEIVLESVARKLSYHKVSELNVVCVMKWNEMMQCVGDSESCRLEIEGCTSAKSSL